MHATGPVWQTVEFSIPNEPVRPSTGDGILTSSTGRGVLEHLSPVSETGGVQQYVLLDNLGRWLSGPVQLCRGADFTGSAAFLDLWPLRSFIDISMDPYAPPASPGMPPLPQDMMPILVGAQFPLTMSFKFLAIAPTITIYDATGRVLLVVRQQIFRIREQVEVFADTARTQKVAHISADRIIDWSARYSFIESNGNPIGATGRKGFKSLWRAHYEVFNPGDTSPDFGIREGNPMAKVMDGLVGSIPVVGLLSLYLFHPKYVATRTNGTPAMSVSKVPAFLEGRFIIERLGPATDRETLNLILAFLMLTLLERRRG